MTASHAPAPTAGFYLRRVVHLASVIDGTPADHALCGMSLQYGAIDTTADATCPECVEVAERLAASPPAAERIAAEVAAPEVPEYLRTALDAYGAALDAHGQTFGETPACSCGRPFRTRRGVGLHVTAEHKRAEREYTAAAAIARNRHRTANLTSTERLAAQHGVPVEQVAATAREVVEEALALVEPVEVVHLGDEYLLDACGTAPRGVGITTAPFTTPERITCPACRPLIEQQRIETVEADHTEALVARCGIALAGGGGPCQARAGHDGRGHDASGQPWSHAYVAPCRRCGAPHPTDADRSACPWTDQPVVDAEEQRQADADTATGTDADRVTISARASELRPGDLVVDALGTRQYAAFDVDLSVPGASEVVLVWTAVADQERGLSPVLRLNARRELLVSRRLTPEQQVEAAELFGDASARPAHVPASVPDAEVDRYLDAYPYPGA